jgi:hypothetical protein
MDNPSNKAKTDQFVLQNGPLPLLLFLTPFFIALLINYPILLAIRSL